MAEVRGQGAEDEWEESESEESEAEEDRVARMVRKNSEMIPDSLLEEALEYLNIGRKEKAEFMCLSVDLNKSEDPLAPPYHWNGEGMKPTELVKLLLERHVSMGVMM